jgi:hypothetical protein
MSLPDRVVGSRVNYWFGFGADGITDLFFLLRGVLATTGSWVSCAVATAAGALPWGLLEYCGHRWFFHLPGSPAHKGHMRHHDEPNELFAMPWFAMRSSSRRLPSGSVSRVRACSMSHFPRR